MRVFPLFNLCATKFNPRFRNILFFVVSGPNYEVTGNLVKSNKQEEIVDTKYSEPDNSCMPSKL